jgi:tetratricopeptide (TPR) repeat protein
MSLILAALLAQIGPSVSAGAGGALPQAPLDIRRKRTEVSTPTEIGKLSQCLALARRDALSAEAQAEAWRSKAKGPERVEALHCRGVALSALGRWSEAVAAFDDARELAPTSEPGRKARFGAMAGNAALAGGDAARAEARLAAAQADALAAPDPVLAGDIAVDRSRAMVALGKLDEAGKLLEGARAASPSNAEGWLLSATLSRRMGKLADGQAQIQQAALLAPLDPAIGLEAGVIAVLAGRDEAARKSWQSVIAAAPDSAEAVTAKSYLDQLGPEPAPKGR